MGTPMTFADIRLVKLDGFRVEIDPERGRADVILDRPPFNIIEMPQRDQLRLVFEAIDEDPRNGGGSKAKKGGSGANMVAVT